MQLDCSSCHLNYMYNALRADEINADGYTLRSGMVRETRGFLNEDLDDKGEPLPGATKVDFIYDHPAKDGAATVHGGWSLRLFVLSNEPAATHDRWLKASKDELVAQVRGACGAGAVHLSVLPCLHCQWHGA